MGADLDNRSVEAAYARWAPIYDLVFHRVMDSGRRAGVAAASRVGPRVLDVGVGTGLELPYFDAQANVVGIDLSEPMLRRAQTRARDAYLRQVIGLCVMDATKLAFPDAAFDAVLAPYLITVVPEPERTLDEIARVVRDDGEIILVNHIGAEHGPRAMFEGWLARQTHQLGWRPDFPWEVIGNWYESKPGIELIERRALSPLGLFTLVRLRKRGASAPAEALATAPQSVD
jgi:phosphatidylethanolamine/phosphatidyl-N-methylethanolamine N-methyltransferase